MSRSRRSGGFCRGSVIYIAKIEDWRDLNGTRVNSFDANARYCTIRVWSWWYSTLEARVRSYSGDESRELLISIILILGGGILLSRFVRTRSTKRGLYYCYSSSQMYWDGIYTVGH